MGTGNHRRRGMTLVELLWIVLLLAGTTWMVFRTRDDGLHDARVIKARDDLEFLAGAIRLAMEEDDPGAWNYPLAGKGQIAPDFSGTTSPLSSLLPEHVPVEADPWGWAYLVLKLEDKGVAYAVVVCAGPYGVLPADLSTKLNQPLAVPVLLPAPD